MPSSLLLPAEEIIEHRPETDTGREIGRSREGRPVYGHELGSGPLKVSLIAGCHADEPVGARTLSALVAYLSRLPATSPWNRTVSWRIVPHANPDGRQRNLAWSRSLAPLLPPGRPGETGYDLRAYLENAVREPPGDDMEFGFPRNGADAEARSENRAIAGFLSEAGPYHLHGSLHGMAFAPGPWFLLEKSWIARTAPMRARLRQRVSDLGYRLFDPDRKGEKGFERIDEGFSTRPDSTAMRRFFEARRDHETASLFRPSSMEFVRGLGGDPLTFVSEMPLFLTPDRTDGRKTELADIQALRTRLALALVERGLAAASELEGVHPMPIADQQRLQLELLSAALEIVSR